MGKIYFAGSISGGRQYLDTYARIVDWLKGKGHSVLTEHVARADVLEMEKQWGERGVYERDVQMLADCDAVVAEVTNPSLGVGYEICYALERSKPVLCLYRRGTFVSRMITGNTSPFITVRSYENDDELFRILATFLETVS